MGGADLESKLPEGQKLPTRMLALMKLLEAEGPAFAQKELITLTGARRLGAECMCLCFETCAFGDGPSEHGRTALHVRRAL